MFQKELVHKKEYKRDLYDSISLDHFPSLQKKILYDLLELEILNDNILIDVFGINLTVFDTNFIETDVWRLREKSKRILSLFQHYSSTTIHLFDTYDFALLVNSNSDWQIIDNSPIRWNNLVLKRISDIHRHYFLFINGIENSIIIGTNISEYGRISELFEALKIIGREIKEYLRLIESMTK